jgi:hypothetical protein
MALVWLRHALACVGVGAVHGCRAVRAVGHGCTPPVGSSVEVGQGGGVEVGRVLIPPDPKETTLGFGGGGGCSV